MLLTQPSPEGSHHISNHTTLAQVITGVIITCVPQIGSTVSMDKAEGMRIVKERLGAYIFHCAGQILDSPDHMEEEKVYQDRYKFLARTVHHIA